MKFSNNLHTPEMTELASRNHIRRFINSELPGAFVVPVSNVFGRSHESHQCELVEFVQWCVTKHFPIHSLVQI